MPKIKRPAPVSTARVATRNRYKITNVQALLKFALKHDGVLRVGGAPLVKGATRVR